jgi:hypothetical protein
MSPKDPDSPGPTDAEFEILTVLWSGGPSTVRDVHEAITKRAPGPVHHQCLKVIATSVPVQIEDPERSSE